MRLKVLRLILIGLAAVCGLGRGTLAQEADDKLMLGTWIASGTSATECVISEATVTLRVFDKLEPGAYLATYVERGELTVKEECTELLESDPESIVPVDIGGAVVVLEVEGDTVSISSSNPDFHTETLTLEGQKMLGADDLGPIEYVKAFPEFRYDAREVEVGWQAIQFPLCEMEQTVMDAISDCAYLDTVVAVLKEALDSAIRAAMEGKTGEVPVEGSRGYNHLEQFDGMTVEEIFDSALPDVAAYLTKEIARVQKALAECDECSNEELRELREQLAKRKEQREAMLEVERARN